MPHGLQFHVGCIGKDLGGVGIVIEGRAVELEPYRKKLHEERGGAHVRGIGDEHSLEALAF